MLDVVEVTKFQISMLSVLSFVMMFLGSWLYRRYLVEYEVKTLAKCVPLIAIVTAPLNFMFILRVNEQYGLPDWFVIIFTEVVSDVFSQCLIVLPIIVLFAKITPANIEATSFAMLAGIYNFRGTLSGYVGTWINDLFVGVSRNDLTNYYILCLIGLITGFIPLFFLHWIPTKKAIADL